MEKTKNKWKTAEKNPSPLSAKAGVMVVFVAIEVAMRREVCFLRLGTLAVRLPLYFSVHCVHSNVALYRHFTGDDHVGTTLCLRVCTARGDALEGAEEPWNRAAVMPLQRRAARHQSQHASDPPSCSFFHPLSTCCVLCVVCCVVRGVCGVCVCCSCVVRVCRSCVWLEWMWLVSVVSVCGDVCDVMCEF